MSLDTWQVIFWIFHALEPDTFGIFDRFFKVMNYTYVIFSKMPKFRSYGSWFIKMFLSFQISSFLLFSLQSAPNSRSERDSEKKRLSFLNKISQFIYLFFHPSWNPVFLPPFLSVCFLIQDKLKEVKSFNYLFIPLTLSHYSRILTSKCSAAFGSGFPIGAGVSRVADFGHWTPTLGGVFSRKIPGHA